jgi:2,4-dienoyl-CoA reductase-like NADH-dependent reductase (Old Yellow Enzyme family)
VVACLFAGTTAGLTARVSPRAGGLGLPVIAGIPEASVATVKDTAARIHFAGSHFVAALLHIGRWGSPARPAVASYSEDPCRSVALVAALTRYGCVCSSWLRRP